MHEVFILNSTLCEVRAVMLTYQAPAPECFPVGFPPAITCQ